MNTGIIITLIVIGGVVCGEVLSCDSCGGECKAACGTRQFRTCCFNYLRKRSTDTDLSPVDPSLRLELWLARSRSVKNVAAPSSPSSSSNNIITPNILKLKTGDLNLAQLLNKQYHQFEVNEDGNDYNIQSTM